MLSRFCGAVLVLATCLCASAVSHAQSVFQGTWDTPYGEVRLKSDGQFVYGDYANRGFIEGVESRDARGRKYLRARFERFDGYVGYVEWVLREYEGEGNKYGLRGRYDVKGKPFPTWDGASGGKWNGEQTSTAVPVLSSYNGAGDFGDFLQVHWRDLSEWMSFAALEAQAVSPWVGTWDTDYGEIRLRQAGNGGPVYGDYGSIGIIKGYARKVGNTWVLRARFNRTDGQTGYVEWASAGKDDPTLTGQWNWASGKLPRWYKSDYTDWDATRTSVMPPQVTLFSGNPHDAAAFIGDDAKFRNWIRFDDTRPRTDLASAPAPATSPTRSKNAAVKKGLALNDGYANILSVDANVDRDKLKTLVSMQEHVQIVSSDGADTVKQKLEQHNFKLLGRGVLETGGVSDARLRAYVARKGRVIVIVFRGTSGDTAGQTVGNAIRSDAPKKLIVPGFVKRSADVRDAERGLRVHKGFYESYEALRPAILQALEGEPKSNLFVFGHSLGGAMATLTALDLKTNFGDDFETVTHIVSGSPRVGNVAFSRYFNRHVRDTLRFAVNKDPIPTVPSYGRHEGDWRTKEKYVHVGRLLVVNDEGKPIDGDDIDIETPIARFVPRFVKYHGNEGYLNRARDILSAQTRYAAALLPNANQWVNRTARREIARAP